MKAVLNVIKKLSRRIEEDAAKVNYLRNLMSTVTADLDGLPKPLNVSKKVEWLAVSIADLEKEISELKAILISCRIELCEWINEKFSGDDVGRILFYRYGLLKKFSEIADELNYSESTIFRLHRLGLRFLGIRASLSDDYEFDE